MHNEASRPEQMANGGKRLVSMDREMLCRWAYNLVKVMGMRWMGLAPVRSVWRNIEGICQPWKFFSLQFIPTVSYTFFMRNLCTYHSIFIFNYRIFYRNKKVKTVM